MSKLRPRNSRQVNLHELFLRLQQQMTANLLTDREVLSHSGTKGDAAEVHWRAMLTRYLPQRYCPDKAFVVDCEGNISEQIDVVIYDRHYSPFLFNQDDARYVSAESVYAVFEAKQEITAQHVKYARQKAASVRRLRRTSAPIPHAGGIYKPRKPRRILAGILGLESSWFPPFGRPLRKALSATDPLERLDLGCALKHGSFEAKYRSQGIFSIRTSTPETSLVFFIFRLLARLQEGGTVPAVDFGAYCRVLEGPA